MFNLIIMEAIDTDWIEEFEKLDEIYKDFYKEQIQSIPIFMIYVDKKNEISFVRKSNISLEDGILKKNNMVALLKEYMYYNEKKYRPISLLKYNINIEPDEVNHYLRNDNTYDFLNIEQSIDDIVFEDSISLFHDINSLYVVFHESWKSFHNKTKKIYIKNKLKKSNNKTKRT